MCFGNNQTTNTTNTSQNYTPASWLTNAAQGNLNFASNLQQNGFTPYTGQQVANFAPQQQQSFGMGNGIAGAVTPNTQLAGGALNQYLTEASGPAPQVNPETISSQMSPYMNQYVNLALQPQLTAAQAQQAQNQQLMQGQATSSGAFGDPRANMLQSNQQLVNDLSNQSLIGNAYNAAFNTAIGAGAQDVANNLNAQTTNAGLQNTQLQNLLAGSNTGYNQATGATSLLNTLGAQQTAQSQAGLNAEYNQWLMAQQYPFQTTQLMDQALYGGSIGAPSTTTGQSVTQQPNNAGYGILGSLLGAGGTILGGPLGGMLGGALGGSLGGESSGGSTSGGFAEGGEPPVGRPAL
ncbi:MAG: hypothetical protein WB622_07205, partial [Acidobacteriaceae bacterium]